MSRLILYAHGKFDLSRTFAVEIPLRDQGETSFMSLTATKSFIKVRK